MQGRPWGGKWASFEKARDYRSARADGSRRCRRPTDSASRGSTGGYRHDWASRNRPGHRQASALSLLRRPRKQDSVGGSGNGGPGNAGKFRDHVFCPVCFFRRQYHSPLACANYSVSATGANCRRRPSRVRCPYRLPSLPPHAKAASCHRLLNPSRGGLCVTAICSPVLLSW